MDTSTPIARKVSLPPRRGRQGQTLVIVLSFMMLMTVLVLVFFGSVMTDNATSRASTGGVAARQLAQSAVQIVEGIISQATVPGSDTSVAWACQPGMIRTYGGGGVASSTPLNYYKLYSAPQMVVNNPGSTFVPDSDIATNWNTQTAFYTDLNQPIYDANNNLDYPIVDPRAQSTSGYSEPYPVQGFSYSNSVTAGTVPGVANTVGSELLPMPVQWIYVLRDGTFASPSGGSGGTASFTGVVTATNPIVGRIAFWTDDECSKVNLNTASEGTYWDTPIANSGSQSDAFSYSYPGTGAQGGQLPALGDMVFANYIPSQHEYQRYPGHPATTCLSPVFGASLASLGSNRASVLGAIDSSTPRTTDGGNTSTLGGTQVASAVLQPNFNRLYSTVDDFNFTPTRGSQTLGGATATQTIIQQSHFFLTTSSKASDLNPFGLPKIAIWPVWGTNNAGARSTLDNDIVRCSTVANGAATGSQHQMIFTRNDSSSPTADFAGIPRNQQLFQYLQTLTSENIPGFGGNFASQYGATDRDQILAEIFDYIRCTNLADQTSGSYLNSYTPSQPSPATPQNLLNNAAGSAAAGNTGPGQVVPIQITGISVSGSPRGLGRIATISELALMLVKVDDRKSLSAGDTSSNLAASVNITDPDGSPNGTSVDPTSHTLIEWSLIPKLFSPMVGYTGLGHNIRLRFSNVSVNFTNGIPLTGPSVNLTLPDSFDLGRLVSDTRDSADGGNIGCGSLYDTANHTSGQAVAPSASMFPTGLVVVPGITSDSSTVGSATVAISAACTVSVYAPNSSTSTAIQTFSFVFPGTTIPLPKLSYSSGTTWLGTYRAAPSAYTAPNPATGPATFTYPAILTGNQTGGLAGKNSGARFTYYDTFFGAGDVFRSLVPIGTLGSTPIEGDMRLVAATQTLPSSGSAFLPALKVGPGPAATTDQGVDCLRMGTGLQKAPGCQYGSLISSVSQSSYGLSPEVPVLPTTVAPSGAPVMIATDNSCPADWDNGPGLLMDGPFVNKPDEGATPEAGQSGVSALPYIGNYDTFTSAVTQSETLFSPNRQISSPVMFGSLPVGLDHPWRTLLFRPASLPGYQTGSYYTHPGFGNGTVPDHLLLDFFRMPVVEPYDISEPLATSGKINLNTQIVPFTYITRTTGLRAVLKSVMITALNPTAAASGGNFVHAYKGAAGTGSNTNNSANVTRYAIDLTDTINQLTTLKDSTSTNNFPEFSRTTYTATNPNFFISPSQICDVPLIPLSATGSATYTNANLSTFWQANALTGDNSLERPYSYIYPRVTTRSNTFTVHVRAQSLKQVPADVTNAVWIDGKDVVTGEYRGSFTVEKYFDPSYAAISTSAGAVLSDTSDGTLPSDAAVRGDNNPAGTGSGTPSSTIQHGALWRLIESKRFGE